MILLEGKTLAKQIVSSLKPGGELHIILVGENPSSLKYVELKQLACQSIEQICTVHRLNQNTSQNQLLSLIKDLNKNPLVTGFFIQLPLPKNFDKTKVLNSIAPVKDVDGLTTNSPFTPAVVKAVVKLLDHYHLTVSDKTSVIINDSKLIGKPLAKILTDRHSQVTICNEFTKNIKEVCIGADFIFSATGHKHLLTADFVKPEAVVFDIGGHDVDFDSVAPKCSYITPIFGGVGPMTIACLLENLLANGNN